MVGSIRHERGIKINLIECTQANCVWKDHRVAYESVHPPRLRSEPSAASRINGDFEIPTSYVPRIQDGFPSTIY